MARIVVEVVDQLDLSALMGAYRGSGGSATSPPAMLMYGYATGTYSSRRIERASRAGLISAAPKGGCSTAKCSEAEMGLRGAKGES